MPHDNNQEVPNENGLNKDIIRGSYPSRVISTTTVETCLVSLWNIKIFPSKKTEQKEEIYESVQPPNILNFGIMNNNKIIVGDENENNDLSDNSRNKTKGANSPINFAPEEKKS